AAAMFVRVMVIAIFSLVIGCEKTDHDAIDKWTHTEKGPDKLRKALSDESIDPDLSAHAAVNLLRTGKDRDAMAGFDTMSTGRRTEVVGKLAPRLWEVARVNGEDLVPSSSQAMAKDMLVNIRRWATDPVKKEIDSYLTDYYCVRSYEGRAGQGVGPTLGAAV